MQRILVLQARESAQSGNTKQSRDIFCLDGFASVAFGDSGSFGKLLPRFRLENSLAAANPVASEQCPNGGSEKPWVRPVSEIRRIRRLFVECCAATPHAGPSL